MSTMINVSGQQDYFNEDDPPGTFDFLKDGSWFCNICCCRGIQMLHLYEHRNGKKHLNNLGITHKTNCNNKNAKKNSLKLSANIQETLDSLKVALVGLEYLLEIRNDLELGDKYYCLLCNKIADGVNTILLHLTETSHITTFLQKHFPNAFNALGSRRYVRAKVIKIASAIENHFGRLKPRVVDYKTYSRSMFRLQRDAKSRPHFNESKYPTLADQCGSDIEEDENPDTDSQTKKRNNEEIFEPKSKKLKRSTFVTSIGSFEDGLSDISTDSFALPDDFIVLDECVAVSTGEIEQVADIDGGTNLEFIKTEIKSEDVVEQTEGKETMRATLALPRKVTAPPKKKPSALKKERKRLRKMGLRVTISIVCEERLTEERKAIVQKSIAEKIIQRPADQEAPQFFDSFFVDKCLIVNCENFYSKSWLEQVVRELVPWKGAELYLGEYKVIKVSFAVPTIFAASPCDVILKMIEDQNNGLATEKWKVVRPHSEENELELVVRVDDKTKTWLESKEWTASLGLGRVTFKLL